MKREWLLSILMGLCACFALTACLDEGMGTLPQNSQVSNVADSVEDSDV